MPFTFHANTLAFGGEIEQSRKPKFLPSQASVALPPTGGLGESSVSDYEDEEVSFARGESRVIGSTLENSHDGTTCYTTIATVSVTKLNIRNRISVELMSTTVTSKNLRENGCVNESSIWFDANIIGLVIDGHPIDVDFDQEVFRKYGTYASFVDAFKDMSEQEVRTRAEAFNWPMEDCETVVGKKKTFHVPRRCTTGLRASLLRKTTPSLKPGQIRGITRQGFTIEVAGFGLIHLGEVLLKAGRRRVNLMRVELNKTLDDLSPNRISLPHASAPPRMKVAALIEGVEELRAAAPGGTTGGTYTLVSGEGNGTDFVP
ncbi:MAG TPA: hypothetical protein VGQ76_26295 [Thermoanaerobaculia bacterium]|jgi:hypothetical protein|nr:hypothetical protein [Thermoanaerobaculia bacterium]